MSAESQNFRVKRGLEVGIGVTITTDEYQVGSSRLSGNKLEVDNLRVLNSSGISTIPNLNLTGSLYDTHNNVGTGSSVLISTGIGVSWIDIPTAAIAIVRNTVASVFR